MSYPDVVSGVKGTKKTNKSARVNGTKYTIEVGILRHSNGIHLSILVRLHITHSPHDDAALVLVTSVSVDTHKRAFIVAHGLCEYATDDAKTGSHITGRESTTTPRKDKDQGRKDG